MYLIGYLEPCATRAGLALHACHPSTIRVPLKVRSKLIIASPCTLPVLNHSKFPTIPSRPFRHTPHFAFYHNLPSSLNPTSLLIFTLFLFFFSAHARSSTLLSKSTLVFHSVPRCAVVDRANADHATVDNTTLTVYPNPTTSAFNIGVSCSHRPS